MEEVTLREDGPVIHTSYSASVRDRACGFECQQAGLEPISQGAEGRCGCRYEDLLGGPVSNVDSG